MRKKEWEDTDEDDFSDNISGSDDDKDPHFVASSVSPKVKRTSMVNKPKSSSHKRPAPFPKDVKKMPPVKQKRKEKSRKPLKGIEAEQKGIEVEKSASETSENISSDNESSEDECPNLAGIKFTVKRD